MSKSGGQEEIIEAALEDIVDKAVTSAVNIYTEDEVYRNTAKVESKRADLFEMFEAKKDVVVKVSY